MGQDFGEIILKHQQKKRPRKGAVDFAESEPDQSIMNTALANQKRPGIG